MLTRAGAASKRRLDESDENNKFTKPKHEHRDIEHRDIDNIVYIDRDYINRVLGTFPLPDSMTMTSNFGIKPNAEVDIELGFKIDVKDVEDCENCEDVEDFADKDVDGKDVDVEDFAGKDVDGKDVDVEDFAGKDVDGKDVDGKDFVDLCKIEVDEAIYKRLLNDKERNLLCYEVLPRDV